MRIGYARVSTEDQTIDLQKDALKRARCSETYEEHAKIASWQLVGLPSFRRSSQTLLSAACAKVAKRKTKSAVMIEVLVKLVMVLSTTDFFCAWET